MTLVFGGCRREAVPLVSGRTDAAGVDVVPAALAVDATAASATAEARAPAALPSVIDWDFGARGHAVVLIARAKDAPPEARYPLVIALHGRGESHKGPTRGPWGWPRDYALIEAGRRVVEPPLSAKDFEGLVTEARLKADNAALAAAPFGGLVIVCPFLPDFDWANPDRDMVASYGHFLTQELIPRARRELPVIADAASTGIDGVSLGGAMALRVGFSLATEFGAVGALQGAMNPSQVAELVALAQVARHKNAHFALRIATSVDDAFVHTNHALDEALSAAGVTHTFQEHLGPHDYIWNRGPGSYELLLFQDRALVHEAAKAK